MSGHRIDLKETLALLSLAMVVFVIVTGIALVQSIVNASEQTETTQAVYKGYLIQEDGSYYPIVEFNSREYVSHHKQQVRDTAYVGSLVTINYSPADKQNFVIQWEKG